jgi:hypothetical protein
MPRKICNSQVLSNAVYSKASTPFRQIRFEPAALSGFRNRRILLPVLAFAFIPNRFACPPFSLISGIHHDIK